MQTIVVSLSGSLISQASGVINIDYLKQFRDLVKEVVEGGKRLIILSGGGKIARDYQKAAEFILAADEEELDWIGIMATRLNAELLRTILEVKEPVIYDPTKKVEFGPENVLVGAGWKPGWSTDYDAVEIAVNIGAKEIINVTHIDYVYDKDPNRHDDAKPFTHLTWKEFRNLVGNLWEPGMNMPFDPIASQEAERAKLKVYIVDEKLKNIKSVINGEKFKGTEIK